MKRSVLLFQTVTSLRPRRVKQKLTAAVTAASQMARLGPAPALSRIEAEKYLNWEFQGFK